MNVLLALIVFYQYRLYYSIESQSFENREEKVFNSSEREFYNMMVPL